MFVLQATSVVVTVSKFWTSPTMFLKRLCVVCYNVYCKQKEGFYRQVA